MRYLYARSFHMCIGSAILNPPLTFRPTEVSNKAALLSCRREMADFTVDWHNNNTPRGCCAYKSTRRAKNLNFAAGIWRLAHLHVIISCLCVPFVNVSLAVVRVICRLRFMQKVYKIPYNSLSSNLPKRTLRSFILDSGLLKRKIVFEMSRETYLKKSCHESENANVLAMIPFLQVVVSFADTTTVLIEQCDDSCLSRTFKEFFVSMHQGFRKVFARVFNGISSATQCLTWCGRRRVRGSASFSFSLNAAGQYDLLRLKHMELR